MALQIVQIEIFRQAVL